MSENKNKEAKATEKQEPRVRVKLLNDHTDAGRDYAAGDVIEVGETTAKWLVENNHGKVE